MLPFPKQVGQVSFVLTSMAGRTRWRVICINPYIAAYVNQGLVSLKRKWQMKYGFGIKIIPDQSLAFLQYRFTDIHGEGIDMKEEIEIK